MTYSLETFRMLLSGLFNFDVSHIIDQYDNSSNPYSYHGFVSYKAYLSKLQEEIESHLHDFQNSIKLKSLRIKWFTDCLTCFNGFKQVDIDLNEYPYITIPPDHAKGYRGDFIPEKNYEVHIAYQNYQYAISEARRSIVEYCKRNGIDPSALNPSPDEETVIFAIPSNIDNIKAQTVVKELVEKKYFHKDSVENLLKYLLGRPNNEIKFLNNTPKENRSKNILCQFVHNLHELKYYGKEIKWKHYIDPFFVWSDDSKVVNLNTYLKKDGRTNKFPVADKELYKILQGLK